MLLICQRRASSPGWTPPFFPKLARPLGLLILIRISGRKWMDAWPIPNLFEHFIPFIIFSPCLTRSCVWCLALHPWNSLALFLGVLSMVQFQVQLKHGRDAHNSSYWILQSQQWQLALLIFFFFPLPGVCSWSGRKVSFWNFAPKVPKLCSCDTKLKMP